MRNLTDHEVEVSMKTHELYEKFIEDLLDVLDGERLSYTVATMIAVAEEILEVAKDIRESHSRKNLLEKMVKEIFGKDP